MSDDDQLRLRIAARNVKALERRVIQLEEEMTLCLKWMRIQAELEVTRNNAS